MDAIETPEKETKLYRTMKAVNEKPVCEQSARGLGVRPIDIRSDESGNVRPLTGGMSVTVNDPIHLPKHLRPRGLNNGESEDPVFEIAAAQIAGVISFRQDAATHGLVEPAFVMSRGDFEQSLCNTCGLWTVWSMS